MKHLEASRTAVDADIKDANLKRLRRIEGQVRGLQKMVEEDRYCPDIITQIASVQEALRGVGRQLLRNHLKHCATTRDQEGPEGGRRHLRRAAGADYFNKSIAVTNRGSMSTGTEVSLSRIALVGGRSTPSVSIICFALA